MESKSISSVTSTCRNTCTTPVGHAGDDIAYLCSWNLLSLLLKCNTKFLEKYKGSLIMCLIARVIDILLDFSLTVKAATLIFISGCGSAISIAKEGKSGFIYNLVKS